MDIFNEVELVQSKLRDKFGDCEVDPNEIYLRLEHQDASAPSSVKVESVVDLFARKLRDKGPASALAEIPSPAGSEVISITDSINPPSGETIDLTALEEDLANNNDPNNNNNDDNQPAEIVYADTPEVAETTDVAAAKLETTWRLAALPIPGDDDEEEASNDSLDFSGIDELEDDPDMVMDSQDPEQLRLRWDTDRVHRLTKGSVQISKAEIWAYLEGHYYEPNRVQIVTEMILGINSETPPESPIPPAPPSPVMEAKCKGRGKGKRSSQQQLPGASTAVAATTALAATASQQEKLLLPHSELVAQEEDSLPSMQSAAETLDTPQVIRNKALGASSISPLLEAEELTPLLPSSSPSSSPSGCSARPAGRSTIAAGLKRPGSPLSEPVSEAPPLAGTGLSNGTAVGPASGPVKPNKTTVIAGMQRRASHKFRPEPLKTEHLHGPFNFSDHRGSKRKKVKKASNLPTQYLHDMLEELKQTPRSSARNRSSLQPVRSSPAAASAVGPAAAKAASVILRPPVLQLRQPPDQHHQRSQARPEPLNKQETVILDIDAETPIRAPTPEAKAKLIAEILEMFPDTDPDYIRTRAEDLVERPAAIERFITELLADPLPPEDWRRKFGTPAQDPDEVMVLDHQHQPIQPTLVVHLDNDGLNDDEPDGGADHVSPHHSQRTASAQHSRDSSRAASSNRLASRSRAASPYPLSRASSPGPLSRTNSPGPASRAASPGPSRPPSPTEEDILMEWEREKLEEMGLLFPEYSPDWMKEIIQGLLQQHYKEPPLNQAEMNIIFQARIEEIFSLDPEAKKQIPTIQEYNKKMKEHEELLKWTGNMTPLDMIELYNGDPCQYFYDQTRVPSDNGVYREHSVQSLKSVFRFHSSNDIEKVFRLSNCLYAPAYKQLKRRPASRKKRRTDHEIKLPTVSCIGFLKEKKFCELEEEISKELTRRKEEREKMVQEAREAGLLLECQVCFSDDCLESDMVACAGGHLFCKDCVHRGAAVSIGEGKSIIGCLGQCSLEIGVQELQKALPPNMLSKLLQKRQMEEVSSAGLEGLVTCPFCPYQTIMENENDKVLACRNPECGRESCRLCKEPNHIPLRCDEVEKKDEETRRKKIEEQLTQALIRECYHCKTKYVKEEGCNKMTCPNCGAKMCYLCKQPVKDYQHFYGQGGGPSATKTCPLWSNMELVHQQELALAAQKAKEELAKDNLSLKYDPTKGIPEPVAGPAGGQQAFPPDVADVIAPGLPREELLRQQRYIEDVILRRQLNQRGPFNPAHPQLPFGPHHHHHPAHVVDMQHMMLRMREILRMREEGRQQQRLARQAEQAALRDLHAQPWMPQPPPPPAAVPPAAAAVQPHHIRMDANHGFHHHQPAPPAHQHLFGLRPVAGGLQFHRYGAEAPPFEAAHLHPAPMPPHHHHHHHHRHHQYPPHGPLPPSALAPLPPPAQLHPVQQQLQPMIAMRPVMIARQQHGPVAVQQQPPAAPLEAAEYEVNRHLRNLWERDRLRLRRGGPPPDQQPQQQRLEGEVNVERVPNNFNVNHEQS